MSGKYYILKDKIPVKAPDLSAWADWFESNSRVVAQTTVGDMRVSTVFLGIDHAFMGGPPLLFETMIFGGPEEIDGQQWRYSAWEGAERGHQHAVEMAKGALQ